MHLTKNVFKLINRLIAAVRRTPTELTQIKCHFLFFVCVFLFVSSNLKMSESAFKAFKNQKILAQNKSSETSKMSFHLDSLMWNVFCNENLTRTERICDGMSFRPSELVAAGVTILRNLMNENSIFVVFFTNFVK